MPVFVEDPSQLSKARLKSDLIAHNVSLPPAKSKKGVYVDLHQRHVDQRNGADFSSDEEPDQGQDDEEPKDAEYVDPSHLTDDDLKIALQQHGVKAGPIVASTRAVYERKLRNLLSNGHGKSNGKENGADEAVLYSDNEQEEDSGEEIEEEDIEESQTQAKVEAEDLSLQNSKQETDQETPLEMYKHLVADKVTPSGIYATCRRPIKGAAGRPVQHIYPETPLSPTTLQRQEVERRLVPLKIQILVFLIVAVLLYLIYVCIEDYTFNPLLTLLKVLDQGLDSEDADTQEVEELLELE